MTLNELKIIGQNWYSRSQKLYDYYQNENIEATKRRRAFMLYVITIQRLAMIANRIQEIESIIMQPQINNRNGSIKYASGKMGNK